MKKILTITLYLFPLVAFSQTAAIVTKQGDIYFESSQYMRAIPVYKEALNQDGSYDKAKYKLAECYRLTHDYESAEFYYQEIAKTGGDPRYPLAGFYYGIMQKQKAQYNEALKTFKRFDEFLVENSLHESEDYRYFHKQSKIELDGCHLAVDQVNLVHEDHQFELLAVPLNSEFNDYAAFTLGSDSILCLTSARKGGKGNLIDTQFGEGLTDFFRFEKTDVEWKKFEANDRFENMVNTKWGDGSGSYNKDRTKFYYTNCHDDLGGVCHIYTSSLINGKWNEPVPLNDNINESGFTSQHPQLSPEGDTLFYASDRKGGLGELDLWMSLNAGGENWGPPTHLGNEINTPFSEISPFYDQAQKVLFFASTGHRGFGGYDTYIARGSSFEAAEIYNAGIPFNSNKDDIFFFLGNKKGYLSSNRDEGIGKFDVYDFNVKSKEEIINELSNEETLAGRNSLFTDDYNFDNEDTELINQIISRKLSSSISNIDVILTSEQLQVYNSLSLDDKDRIEKIVNTRIRKMTASRMRSIRSEDNFFYQELATAKRKKVNKVVTNYVEQEGMGLSVFLAQESSSFYGSVVTDDREKIDGFITERVGDARKIKHQSTNYDAFTEPDKENIDGIAFKYLSEKKNLESLDLRLNERVFLNKADDGKKQKLDVAVREKLLTLSEEKRFELNDEDRAYYETLTQEEKESIKSMASAFLLADLNTIEDVMSVKDTEIFKYKDDQVVQTLNRLLLKQISNLMKASMYVVETSFTPEELRSLEGASVEESLAELLRINSKLSEKDKVSLQQFVKTSFQSYLTNDTPAFTSDIPLASVMPSSSTPAKGDPSAVLNNEVLTQYKSLPEEKRWLVDKNIGLNYLNGVYADDPQLISQDNSELKSSSTREKAYFKVLAKNMRHESLNPSEAAVLLEAFTFYNNLAPSRKAMVNRIVLTKTFDQRNGKFYLTPKDGALRARLTPEEREMVASIKKFRMNNERILTENLAVEAKDTDAEPVDVIALTNNNRDEIDSNKAVGKSAKDTDAESGDALASAIPSSSAPTKGDPSAVLNSEVLSQYETLSEDKRSFVDKTIGLNYLNGAYADDPQLNSQDNSDLKSSSIKEKSYFDVLAKNTRHESLNNSEEATLSEAFTYYNNLAPSRKAVVNRIVLAKSFDQNNGKFSLTPKDEALKDKLSSEEMKMLASVEKSRMNNEQILVKNLGVGARDAGSESIDDIALANENKNKSESNNTARKTSYADKMGGVLEDVGESVKAKMADFNFTGFEELVISGRLVNAATGNPLAGHKISLLRQDESKTVIEELTTRSGDFSFKVPTDKYLIAISRENGEGAISIKTFDMYGNRKEHEGLVEIKTRAYFNSDSYVLRSETKEMLDELIEWARGKPVHIALESHTDSLGDEEYNVKLSKDRGHAARDYLMKNGISVSQISVIWHGFEKPIAANDNPIGRQLNRRMDVWITAKTIDDKLHLGHYYLVRPKASLSAIAQSFDLSVEELKRMNGITSNTITEYTPIRVVSSTVLNPDLNLVVPADFNIITDFRYTVEPGDDVIKLARKFNVPEELILELNGLKSIKLTPGDKIKIY